MAVFYNCALHLLPRLGQINSGAYISDSWFDLFSSHKVAINKPLNLASYSQDTKYTLGDIMVGLLGNLFWIRSS